MQLQVAMSDGASARTVRERPAMQLMHGFHAEQPGQIHAGVNIFIFMVLGNFMRRRSEAQPTVSGAGRRFLGDHWIERFECH